MSKKDIEIMEKMMQKLMIEVNQLSEENKEMENTLDEHNK